MHGKVLLRLYLLQSIFGISQSLGLTEPTSQSIRLPDITSQYIGLPKNISHSLGLPKKYFYFSHRLTEMNVSVITASLYLIGGRHKVIKYVCTHLGGGGQAKSVLVCMGGGGEVSNTKSIFDNEEWLHMEQT